MSIEIPLLIREKLDYYLYFRVWQNRIGCVNLEYVELRMVNYSTGSIAMTKMGEYLVKSYNYRNLDIEDFRGVRYINSIRSRGSVCILPKHYYHIILKEIL